MGLEEIDGLTVVAGCATDDETGVSGMGFGVGRGAWGLVDG
ncbi:MAG: hypothetical protein ACK4OE_03055 [Acidovorax sp.]